MIDNTQLHFLRFMHQRPEILSGFISLLSLSLTLFLSFSFSSSLSFNLFLCLSLHIYLSVCLSLFLCLSLTLSIYLSLSVYLCVTFLSVYYVYLSLSLSDCLKLFNFSKHLSNINLFNHYMFIHNAITCKTKRLLSTN